MHTCKEKEKRQTKTLAFLIQFGSPTPNTEQKEKQNPNFVIIHAGSKPYCSIQLFSKTKKKIYLTPPWKSFHLTIPKWCYRIQLAKRKRKTKAACQILTQEIEWAKHGDSWGEEEVEESDTWQDLPSHSRCQQAEEPISDVSDTNAPITLMHIHSLIFPRHTRVQDVRVTLALWAFLPFPVGAELHLQFALSTWCW